jgi:tetratricopeptide (TPR) repeat protein
MHNYDELEKIYYRKKFKRYFIYGALLLLVIGLVLFIYYKFNVSKASKVPNQIKKIESNTSIKIKKPVKIIKSEKKEQNKSIKKSIKHIDKLILNPVIPDINFTSSEPKEKTTVKKSVKQVKKQEPVKKPIIKIQVIKKKESLSSLINSYNVSDDYTTAIKIANIYFKRKNYNKSIEWAKKANDINAENYESWLLYAKSLVKLGEINKAKKLLKSYIEIYGQNASIEDYLRSIK